MTIDCVCEHCQKKYRVKAGSAGKQAKCAACGKSFTVVDANVAARREREQSVADLLDDEYRLADERPPVASNDCPNCGAGLPEGAVLCVTCGYHLVNRTKLTTDNRPVIDTGVPSRSDETFGELDAAMVRPAEFTVQMHAAISNFRWGEASMRARGAMLAWVGSFLAIWLIVAFGLMSNPDSSAGQKLLAVVLFPIGLIVYLATLWGALLVLSWIDGTFFAEDSSWRPIAIIVAVVAGFATGGALFGLLFGLLLHVAINVIAIYLIAVFGAGVGRLCELLSSDGSQEARDKFALYAERRTDHCDACQRQTTQYRARMRMLPFVIASLLLCPLMLVGLPVALAISVMEPGKSPWKCGMCGKVAQQ